MLSGKHILLIVGGGIAAYKCPELVRRLKERGAKVRAVMTRSATEFVTPLSLASLTGEKIYTDLFNLTDELEMGHIQLSRDADLLVVAPATADLMAKMAAGFASDLATTTLLATDKHVLIAPAMNVRMWHHPATQRSLRQLEADGVICVGPNDGEMACGEFGPGRMAEPGEILTAVEAFFSSEADRPLSGRRAIVTAGPTHEPIDAVRYIANRSSGKQGYAIAGALRRLGAETTLVTGPTNLATPAGVDRIDVETAEEMLAACQARLPADIAIFCAAVADWRVVGRSNAKLKKKAGETPRLDLVENPDIIATLSKPGKNRPKLIIGFAAETENVIAYAEDKRHRKGCDWILANDVSPETGVMGGDANTIHLITEEGREDWPTMSKRAVAETLARRIAKQLEAAIG